MAPGLERLLVPIGELQPDPSNARLHLDVDVEAAQAALRQFGQQKPIVVRADGVVVAGNGLYEAARRLGWARIAAVTFEGTDKQAAAYALVDNRTAELSRWDEEVLHARLLELAGVGDGLDLTPYLFGEVVDLPVPPEAEQASSFLDGSIDDDALEEDPMMRVEAGAPDGHAFFEAKLTEPQNESLVGAMALARRLAGPPGDGAPRDVDLFVGMFRSYAGAHGG